MYLSILYWRVHKWTPFFRSGFMKTEYGGRIISPDLLATLVVGLAALIQYVLILPWHKNMLLTCSACPLGQWAFCKAHFYPSDTQPLWLNGFIPLQKQVLSLNFMGFLSTHFFSLSRSQIHPKIPYTSQFSTRQWA